MPQSVGAVALDIIMGKNTVTSVVKSAMAECQKVLSDSSASMANKVGAVGNAMQGVGKALMPVSAAAIGAGVAIGKMSTDFENAMAKVNTIADTTEVPLGDLQKQIIELSNQTGISSSEIADNVYNAISAGQKTGDAVNFVANSTKLARAGFADAGASLDVLTTILNSYGMEASEVTKVSDVLIQTQNKGKTTVGELSAYMGKVIPTANAYGVNLENIATNYAIMTAKGIATAESTTYMNSMLNELGKSSTGVAKELKNLTGKSFKELMDGGASVGDVLMMLKDNCDATGTQFTDLWGSAEAGKAALVLTQEGAEGFNNVLKGMQDSTGATQAAFDKMETKGYTLQKAWNTVKNTAIDLGGALMQTLGPMIENLSNKVAAFTKWFSALDEGTKQLIVKAGLVVAAAGPVLIVAGKIVSGIGSLMGAIGKLGGAISTIGSIALKIGPFITGTIMPAIGALFSFLAANPIVLIIGAIVAAGVLLITHWKEVKAVAVSVWTSISSFFTATWTKISNFFKNIWNGIKTTFITVITAIANFANTHFGTFFDDISNVFNNLLTFFTAVWEAIKTVFLGAVLLICDLVRGDFSKLKEDFNNILGRMKEIAGTIFNAIKGVITNSVNAIKSFFTGAWNGISSIFSGIVNGIKTTAINVFNAMKNGISNTVSGIRNAIVNGFNSAISWIKALPSQAVTWGKDMIQGIINGIKSMIGAVGNAVKGVANKIRSFLHFSVPDEGPLTDYETWMPDFMSGLAKGIKDSQYLVQDAVNGVASSMSVNPVIAPPQLKNATGGAQTAQAAQSDGNNNKVIDLLSQMIQLLQGDREFTVPVYLGADLLDEQTVKASRVRALRSGGRA